MSQIINLPLGAILAGGRSSRFGSDKAEALLGGRPLIAHVHEALAPQCAQTIVVGREWGRLQRVDDAPEPGLGPLGGLLGALRHAERHGFTSVITSGCDLPSLPGRLEQLLSPAPAVIADQPTVGLWPASLASALDRHIRADPKRSIRGWLAACGGREVVLAWPIPNVNTQADLDALSQSADPRSSL
jgi:molybdopterin-guanine dinucleotide biosynthesis protein A